jgi:Protein of unknown function (DUF2934)
MTDETDKPAKPAAKRTTRSAAKPAATKAKPAAKRTSKSRAKKPKERTPEHEDIAQRAYYIHLEEGGGNQVEHWLRAERELKDS